MRRRVALATLGCRLNQVDTQQIQAGLEARGFVTVPVDAAADVVVVNTCTVTARAESSDRQAIRRARRVNPAARIVVTGCWAQTSPDDVARVGGVDLVVGNADKHRLPELVEGLLAAAASFFFIFLLALANYFRLSGFLTFNRRRRNFFAKSGPKR